VEMASEKWQQLSCCLRRIIGGDREDKKEGVSGEKNIQQQP